MDPRILLLSNILALKVRLDPSVRVLWPKRAGDNNMNQCDVRNQAVANCYVLEQLAMMVSMVSHTTSYQDAHRAMYRGRTENGVSSTFEDDVRFAKEQLELLIQTFHHE